MHKITMAVNWGPGLRDYNGYAIDSLEQRSLV